MRYPYQIALSYATENEELVSKVYHYLRAEGLSVFFASAPECQDVLSGKNQREIFYSIFGLQAEFVALFVSKDYVKREVPMEEARIAFSKHSVNGTVIPVYLDGTELPQDMLNPKETNYFRSNDPARIAAHLAARIVKMGQPDQTAARGGERDVMIVSGNTGDRQVFIQNMKGNLEN